VRRRASRPHPSAAVDTGAIISDQPSGSIVTAPKVTTSMANTLVVSAGMSCGAISGLRSGSAFQALPILSGENVAYLLTTDLGTAYGAVWNASNGTWNASTVTFR
jgi:hypothetical protein